MSFLIENQIFMPQKTVRFIDSQIPLKKLFDQCIGQEVGTHQPMGPKAIDFPEKLRDFRILNVNRILLRYCCDSKVLIWTTNSED